MYRPFMALTCPQCGAPVEAPRWMYFRDYGKPAIVKCKRRFGPKHRVTVRFVDGQVTPTPPAETSVQPPP